MSFKEVFLAQFPDIQVSENLLQPAYLVKSQDLPEIALFLISHESAYFDLLESISAVDFEDRFELYYHFWSVVLEQRCILRVELIKNEAGESESVPSLVSFWRTAEWHERECWDLMGIKFENHPDLRRILLPEDWPGHPLRKNYQNPESYHNIPID